MTRSSWILIFIQKRNPDGADAFVRSAPTTDGTISPSEQDSFCYIVAQYFVIFNNQILFQGRKIFDYVELIPYTVLHIAYNI